MLHAGDMHSMVHGNEKYTQHPHIFFLQRKWMFPTQRMLSREDDPAAPLFPSDFFANINSNKDEQVHTLWSM